MSEDGEDAPDYQKTALSLLAGKRPPEDAAAVVGELRITTVERGEGLLAVGDRKEVFDWFKPQDFKCGLTLESYLRYWNEDGDEEDDDDGDDLRPLPDDGGREFA